MLHPHRKAMMEGDRPKSFWPCPLEENEFGTSPDNAADHEGSFRSQPQGNEVPSVVSGRSHHSLLDAFEHAFPPPLHKASQAEGSTHAQSILNVNALPVLNSPSTSFTPPSLPTDLLGQYDSVFVGPTLLESQLDTPTHHGSIFNYNYLSAPIEPNAGPTPCQPSSLTNGRHHQALDLPNANYPSPLLVPPHTCGQCGKSYSRKGELTRHVATTHHRPRSFLCHIDRCPRGIFGKGFARKDKLVDHLVSKKHGLSKVDASYEANLYNV